MSDSNFINVTWVNRGFEPRAAADPRYPDGMHLDISQGRKACTATLPYPARRCGYYIVECQRCDTRSIVSTAGRRDNPRSIKIACKSVVEL